MQNIFIGAFHIHLYIYSYLYIDISEMCPEDSCIKSLVSVNGPLNFAG